MSKVVAESEFQCEPRRVAIIGAGPSGLYAAKALLSRTRATRIHVIDRLPTPYGLIRYGIAPDNQKMKRVKRVLMGSFNEERVAYFGNVALNDSADRHFLLEHYDAIIYAIGAQGERRLNVYSGALPGVHSAKYFVDWYNGAPNSAAYDFPLEKIGSVAVVGGGNVALDVARMLLSTQSAVAATDVPDRVLSTYGQSHVTRVYLIARRGPLDCKFTPVELRRLGELPGVDIFMDEADFRIGPREQRILDSDQQRRVNMTIYKDWLGRGRRQQAPRELHLLFCQSPTSIVETHEGAKRLALSCNHLDASGAIERTSEGQDLAVDCVLEAIGQRVTPPMDLPFDPNAGAVPNEKGRISFGGSEGGCREYVVGWAKRGPTGVVGTNKGDAEETVDMLLNDSARRASVAAGADDASAALVGRYGDLTDWACWERIDALEIDAGERQGRPRAKLCSLDEMLACRR